MAGIVSLGHIALRAKDVQRTVDFYQSQLGFNEVMRLNYEDGSLWLVYLRVTDTQFLEVFPGGVGDKASAREAVGVNHFCLTVDDIDGVVADLVRRGVTIQRPLKMGPDGNRQAWIEDPDGVRIELMEMAKDAVQFQAVRRLHQGQTPIAVATDRKPELALVR
ncbi:MAG: VOC family protein [Proteobacteria bacterium]|nr:VOC family protein [Pseudomonadota bacterium]MBI3498419.1 VOC family protein [Pseudomonadota bacterium]